MKVLANYGRVPDTGSFAGDRLERFESSIRIVRPHISGVVIKKAA